MMMPDPNITGCVLELRLALRGWVASEPLMYPIYVPGPRGPQPHNFCATSSSPPKIAF